MTNLNDFEIVDGKLKKYKGNSTVVEIPDGVTSIDNYAFYICASIKEIKLPNSVQEIGHGAFKSCVNLKKINIPRSVVAIGNEAFANCRTLASIEIPTSVKTMGDRAFYFCPSLIIKCEATKCPSGWVSGWKLANSSDTNSPFHRPVWGYKFPSDKKDDYVMLNGKIKKYTGTDADIVIPEDLNVTEIGDFAFMNCTSIKSVKIPNGVTVIGTRAFWGCSSLNNIQIPNSVTTIGAGVFYDCSSLEKITIPSSVVKMGYNVFLKCPNVVIYADTNAKPVGWDNQWNPDKRPVFWKVEPIAPQKNEQVKVRDDRSKEELDKFVKTIKKVQEKETRKFVETVKKAQEPKVSPLSDFKIRNGVLVKYLGKDETLILPEEICAIDGHTFVDNETVKKVILPKTLTTIGAGAFLDCYNLEEIFIPKSVTKIERLAFRGCEKLTIYCEITTAPRGWDTRAQSKWNGTSPVVWGHKLK